MPLPKRTLAVLTAAAALLLSVVLPVACNGLPAALPVPAPAVVGPKVRGTHPIQIVSHGWHTGLVLPAGPLRQEIPVLAERFPSAVYLELGWGDEGFYQAREVTTGLALEALFWSRGTVLHAVGFSVPPAQYFKASRVHTVCLTDEGYRNLRAFLRSSFQADPQGRMTPMGPGLYGDSQFYRGVGRYHALNTCNSWTARGLSSGGLPIRSSLQLTAGGIMGSVSELPFAACEGSGP